MALKKEVYVGLDLGTSSLKGVAVAASGEVVARGHAAYPTRRAEPRQAEQDTSAWLRAVRRVVSQLADDAPTSAWAAVGLSAMIPTLVLVNGDGLPTGPAITWEDSRAEGEGEELRRAVGADLLYDLTGQWVDGRYLLPMVRWLLRNEPARVATATRVLSAKDYLFAWLTGEYLTDPSTASGFGGYRLASGAWLADVCALAGVSVAADAGVTAAGRVGVTDGVEAAGQPGMPALPAVLPATTVRPLTLRSARQLGLPAGLPICLGAADSVLGMRALGVDQPGEVAYVTGTSTVILALSERLLTDAQHRYLVTPLAGTSDWGLEMDLLSTGAAVHWLKSLLRLGRGGEAKLMALAEQAPPGANEVRFLPYLSLGEQAALWDPDLRGTLFGLSLGHGPAELARALVEGIVLETRRCIQVLDEAGLPAGPLRVAGEGGAARFLRQQLADATGRPVTFTPGDERPFSALGAAQVAAQSQGVKVTVALPDAATENLLPDSAQRSWWDDRWAAHRDLVAKVQAIYRR